MQKETILAFNDINTTYSTNKYIKNNAPKRTKKVFPQWWHQISTEPILAVKTNLLYDAVSVLNAEIEVPIGNSWSVAGKYIFPWWTTKNNGNAVQINAVSLGGKYWLGSKEKRNIIPKLTGWNIGLYIGAGLYDLQIKNNGYQGEFLIAAGTTCGYAHAINRNKSLRLEYSLGLGYMKTNYRYYEGMEDNKFLVWQYDGKYSWIGPTKIDVSLVWMISRKVKHK